ncbi:MAG TPA: hypothetical protein PLL90_10675 [Bacteroidales bacterium]|nr:hypothetical protein [Bacteroidales bacterium]
MGLISSAFCFIPDTPDLRCGTGSCTGQVKKQQIRQLADKKIYGENCLGDHI